MKKGIAEIYHKRYMARKKWYFGYKWKINKSLKKPRYQSSQVEVLEMIDGSYWVPFNKIFLYTKELERIFLKGRVIVDEYDISISNPLL